MQANDGFTGPVNLGNPKEFTVRELANTVLDLTTSRSTLVEMPLPQDDPRQRCPDITMAREQLDWEPGISLEEGLRPTIEWFEGLIRQGLA